MGGKAKLLDPNSLEGLYIESIHFKYNAEETSNNIRFCINKITDPLFLSSMKGNEDDDFIESIMAGKQVLEDFLETLNATANFIDSILEGTVSDTEKIHGLEKNKDDSNPLHNKLNLKR